VYRIYYSYFNTVRHTEVERITQNFTEDGSCSLVGSRQYLP